MTGLLILAAALVAALAFGLHRRRVDGRFRDVAPAEGSGSSGGPSATVWDVVAGALPDAAPGEQATLVQFSSAFCAPCRTTRVVLADVAAKVDGVVHLEVDAEAHLDLVRALDVRRTPTTIVLGADGAEITRAAGAPRREQVLAALATAR